MPKCPKCQSEVDASARFCYVCGTDLTAASKCPGCGAELVPGSIFCTSCGARLSTGVRQAVGQAPVNAPAAANTAGGSFPDDVATVANHYNGPIANGGRLHITPTELIFCPHAVNFNTRDYTWRIADVVKMEKGFLTNFYITFADGKKHHFALWKKNFVIDAVNKRRAALGLPPA